MDLKPAILPNKYFLDISKRLANNEGIQEYYKKLFDETNQEKFMRKADSINSCCKLWDIDYFRLMAVKDVLRVNLCHDKFCLNCQNMLSLKRQAKYTPILDSLKTDYDIYHIVFTIPNVPGEHLKNSILQMFKAFSKLIRFFSSNAKIRNINFDKYGYVGAIRSLEITQNIDDLLFHPHLHCLFVFKKGLNLEKTIVNKFSYSIKSREVRKFSDFEILLQKIWFLTMNSLKVTKTAITELSLGYSAIAEESGESYHEIFKYAIKNNLKQNVLFDYQTFKTYYETLYKRKTIQGYGILYNYDFEDDTLEETENEYYLIREYLEMIEEPLQEYEYLSRILYNLETTENVKYISKKFIRKYILDQT